MLVCSLQVSPCLQVNNVPTFPSFPLPRLGVHHSDKWALRGISIGHLPCRKTFLGHEQLSICILPAVSRIEGFGEANCRVSYFPREVPVVCDLSPVRSFFPGYKWKISRKPMSELRPLSQFVHILFLSPSWNVRHMLPVSN